MASAQKQLLVVLAIVLSYSLLFNYLSGYYLSLQVESSLGSTAFDANSLHFMPGIVDLEASKSQYNASDFGGVVDDDDVFQNDEASFLADPDASFGACLMLMDDNHFLVEWLAYHYFALPLRHVIVLVDPKSTTSPQAIFDRWKDYNITIEVMNWTYPDAYSPPPPNAIGTLHEMPENRRLIGRQLKFYEDCMRRYKLHHQWDSWIVLSDPDEYWSITPMTQDRDHKTLYRGDDFPSVGDAGSVMDALKQEYMREVVVDNARRDRNQTPGMCWDTVHLECIGVPRMQICADPVSGEFPAEESDYPADIFNSSDLVTLRWLYYPARVQGLRMPKNMLHMGGIKASYMRDFDALTNGAHPHRFLPGRCEKKCYRSKSVFQIYHYSGSPEQRTYREDPRGGWGERGGSPPVSCVDGRYDASDLVPWLDAFVELVGPDEAKRLLEGVGRVDSWPAYKL